MSGIENNKIKIYDEDVKEWIKTLNVKKATMQGVYHDLEKLKEELLKVYDPHIFWLNYYKADAPYMGWRFDDPEYKNMMYITEEIEKLFLKMYVLTELGLGNTLLTDDKDEEGYSA